MCYVAGLYLICTDAMTALQAGQVPPNGNGKDTCSNLHLQQILAGLGTVCNLSRTEHITCLAEGKCAELLLDTAHSKVSCNNTH